MAHMKMSEVEGLPWQEVESSNVARVAFGAWRDGEFITEADVGVLYVEFHGSGRVYCYDNMRREQHTELVEADSVGGYLNAEIKPSHNCTRIEVVADPPGPPTPPKPAGHRPVG